MFSNIFIKIIITLLLLITIFNNCKLLNASELAHVYCNKAFILVELPVTSSYTDDDDDFHNEVYWENLPLVTAKECQPLKNYQGFSIKILLQNLYKCGFVRSVNNGKHHVSYYQNLIIKQNSNITSKIHIKCLYKMKTLTSKLRHKLVKRDVLPDNFQEDVDIEVVDTIEQQAPEPQVLMEVRQNNELIDGMVTVIPGTPLVMEIKLNEAATNIYGLKVNFLEVTDMIDTSETILYRGCTVDPYLFENFNLTAVNSLKSKFRAFKFPNTAFVQFKANVQICLKSCPQTQCIGGNNKQTRKRRELSPLGKHTYVINSSFILKLNESSKGHEADFIKLQNHVEMLHIKNQHLIK